MALHEGGVADGGHIAPADDEFLLIDIDAVIYCERDSHKGMIIGKQGRMLKKIASEARLKIEDFL